ncbi:Tetratricopeptide TPR-1 [Macrophomina phaseolina MS6]|uniref:Tetratricopeptide TPR-1 n=1 Tax=Macrophomina phaseolina (strain MS6) TaxID=1126212 RepID=K2RXR6_MACPH|nr:Tetratricopeptide TPR-1 [Macrophomina phaseolina MS6]
MAIHDGIAWALHHLGDLYSNQGKLAEAEEMYERALDGYQKAFGPDHTATLTTTNNLGLLYFDQGKVAQAEEMYERALSGYEKALGPDHMSTLTTANILGLLYLDQGKLAEAGAIYQRLSTHHAHAAQTTSFGHEIFVDNDFSKHRGKTATDNRLSNYPSEKERQEKTWETKLSQGKRKGAMSERPLSRLTFRTRCLLQKVWEKALEKMKK